MPAEASIRFRAESQQARREIQTLWGTLAQLNKTLAEQRNQLIGATAEEQKNIRAHIAANNALKTTMRSQIEQTNLRKQAIAQTQREAKERERLAQQQVREAQRVGKAQEQAARRASAAQSALIADLTRGARVVYQELSRLTTGFVSAAADMETFRNSVQAVTRDTTETNRILAELLELTVELVGIETGTLISYAGRLMAAGLSAEEAITAIRGVTERIAEQGKSASVTARVMEQLTQSFNAGIATMQDFRPILREMPTFWRDASNALGVQITNLEDFRQAADAAGGNTQALLLVLAEMGRASEGANLDTLNAQIDILSDQARLLQAELGEHLIPAIVAIAKEVNVWIERFRNLDDRAQAAIAWAIALATALTGLSVIVGTATLGFGALSASLAAITGVAGVAGLTAGIGGLTAAFVAAAPFIAVGGIIVGGIALLAKAIRDTSESARVLRTEIKRLDEVTRVYNLTTGQLEVVTASQSEAFAVFQQRVKNAQDDVGNISNLLRQNRMEQEGLNKAMAVASGDAIPALQLQLRGLKAEGQELSQALDDATNKLQGLQFEVAPDESTLTDPIESLEEQLVRAVDQVIRLRDSFSELSRSEDIQAIESAASDLTGALRRELTLQLMDAELTAAERLDLELTHAREVEGVTTDTQNRIRKIAKETTEAQAEAVERQTDAQIAFAARARSAEVARWEAAAASGASYAKQLSEIGSPEHRQRFVQMVEQLQDQGVMLEQARAEAARYIPILAAISNPIQTADVAYQKFSSTLVDESNRSADAVANLLSGVQALGVALGERLPDSEGSLERSLLNERQYFQQNPAGRTLDDIQGEAGEQGRNFVNRLFRRQDREAEKAAIEAQRESIQLYNDLSAATVDFTGSLIDLKGETNLADHAFQDFLGTFGRLATGDFTALLDIPIRLLNISRQAAAEREQGARDRAALYEEQFGEFERFGRNFDVVSGVLGIPESPELSDSLFFNPAGEFENVLAQSTADFSDGIKNALLASVINLERDIRPEDIAGIFQSSIEGLQENLDAATFNLDFARQTDGNVEGALQNVIGANTEYYQRRIDAANVERRLFGDSIDNVEELNRILQAANNETALQLERVPTLASQRSVVQRRQRDRAARQEGDASSDAYTRSLLETGDFTFEELNANDTIVAAAQALESLETQIANRVANDALGAIREAASDVNATAESIIQLWEDAQPSVEAWYNELLEDAQLIENEAERTEALAALGTLPDFVANLKSQYVTPVVNSIQRATEALETRTATRLANEAISAISEVASDVNVTEQAILERWNEAVPRIEAWWSELYEDIVNNPDLTDAERTESLAELGTQQDFVSSLKSQYVTPVLSGIAQATEALQTRTANRLAQDAISAIGEAAGDVNATEQEILDQWTQAIPALENWWSELYEDIVNNPNLSDAQQSEDLAALGSQQDFVASLKSQYVTPIITSISQAAEALQTRTANRLAQGALGAIREAASDVNVTEQAIAQLWTDALPLIETWYQELLDDANAIENEGLRDEAIADLGSPESFIASLKSQYVTPIITGIQRSAEALETRTANRLAQGALKGLRDATSDTNITEQAIVDLWTAALPLLENWYQELLDDANAIENEGLRDEAIADLGSPESFIASLKSQYVTPIITGIQSGREALETRTANRLANDALGSLREAAGDVNITEAEIANLWTTALPLIENWYQELLDDANAIENEGLRDEAVTDLGSPEAFIANLKSQYVTPIITGISQATEALQTRTANRLANDAISAISDVANDVNVTEEAIIDKWQEAVPFIEGWWQELSDDIVNNENLNDADIAESLAELGSVEAFVGNIRSQYVTPVLNNILQTRFGNRSNRAQSRRARAQFDLGGATSESDFENRRDVLIQAVNDYYDAEEERIRQLDQSHEDLGRAIKSNQLARDQALRQATTATNTFAQDRLRAEERVQADIDDLRDDALENEQVRQQALQDLAESHQDRLTDIEEDGIRRREDLQRESQRSLEDLRREFQEDQFDVGTQLDRGEITREEAEQQISDLTGEFLRDSGDLQRRQRRALEDQGIREERQQEDAAEGFTKSQQQIETEARATATAIQTALTPLLTEQQTGEVAEKQVAAADKQIEAADAQTTAADDLGTVVTGLKDSDIPGAIDLVRQSAEASLGISSAISALPSLLESSFERIFDDLQETIVDILEIESGILGINPEQFAPPEVEMPTPNMSEITAMVETDVPLDVKVINPDDLYDPAEIERLREDGRNNREIGVHLREIASLAEPTRPDVSMRGLSDLTARIGAAEALSATRAVPTAFTADTVNVSGSVVNVSGGNRSGSRESETPQSRFPVEGDELRADITLEFPDGTIQEISNQMLRLKQQDRT